MNQENPPDFSFYFYPLMIMKVKKISLEKALDSRAEWTVKADINGKTALSPSGASKGSHEANCFVPENLKEIEKDLEGRLEGRDLNLKEFDGELEEYDESEDFSRIGAASISLSMAFKKSLGFKRGEKFPFPLSNVIGGGAHGGKTSIQEFLVIPLSAESFPEAVETNAKVYHELKKRYKQKIMGINDEGALVTRMGDEETLKALKKVSKKFNADIGLDIAASEFYEDGKYKYDSMGMELGKKEQRKFVKKIIDKYGLVYVEDPFHEEDFESFADLKEETHNCLIVGDDLFTTNPERLQRGVELEAGNSLIVKPNQIGNLTKTRKTLEIAEEEDFVPVLSHRSGETCDYTISDLSLEWEIPIIKLGIAGIRIAKINKLLSLWYKMSREKNLEMNDSLSIR